MLQGWCNAQNPQSNVILRQVQSGFAIYWDGEFQKIYSTIDEGQFALGFLKDFVKNPVRVLGINVPALGPVEVVDWVTR